MKHNFEKAGFTLKDAREFDGKLCSVTCSPSQLREWTTTKGVVYPFTRTTTFVGGAIVFNNEVLEIEDGLESSSV
jgi:hypothetical protein